MIASRAVDFFGRRFGGAPAIVGVAPGRVNLIGEHVDYADGLVLPMAIEKSTAVAVRPARGESMIVSEGFEGAWRGDFRAGLTAVRGGDTTWANYVLGPIAELAGLRTVVPNVECAVVSDVPSGGGVSSSAALEVATAMSIAALLDRPLSGIEVALLCQRAEHRFAGTPCGIMDMTVSANAIPNHAILIDCRSRALRHVPLPANVEVMVIDSGVRHRLSDGGYATRREAVERAARAMGLAALRDASLEALDGTRLDPLTHRRARHVITEIERTSAAADALASGSIERFGELMQDSHRSLRDDFEVSVPEIDCIVDAANGASGTYGARLTGGGFGGCAVALVKRGAADGVIEAVNARFAPLFGRSVRAFVTGAAGGATVVRTEAIIPSWPRSADSGSTPQG